MTPISANQLQADFTALAEVFQSGRVDCVSDAELQIMCEPHHSVPQLIALGWLEAKPCGRWSKVLVPAGALLDHLVGTRSTASVINSDNPAPVPSSLACVNDPLPEGQIRNGSASFNPA